MADGTESLTARVKEFKAARATEAGRKPEISAPDRAWVKLPRALLDAQRTSWAQYVFTVGSIAEGATEGRWLRGDYKRELASEQGRRFSFHSDELRPALRDVVTEAFDAARAATEHGGFRAAVTLLGSALEGLLLERCLRSPKKARAVADALPRRLRTRATDDEGWRVGGHALSYGAGRRGRQPASV